MLVMSYKLWSLCRMKTITITMRGLLGKNIVHTTPTRSIPWVMPAALRRTVLFISLLWTTYEIMDQRHKDPKLKLTGETVSDASLL